MAQAFVAHQKPSSDWRKGKGERHCPLRIQGQPSLGQHRARMGRPPGLLIPRPLLQLRRVGQKTSS